MSQKPGLFSEAVPIAIWKSTHEHTAQTHKRTLFPTVSTRESTQNHVMASSEQYEVTTGNFLTLGAFVSEYRSKRKGLLLLHEFYMALLQKNS